MKLKEFLMVIIVFISLILTLVIGDMNVSASEQKVKSVNKNIQSTSDIPFIPENYAYRDWRAVAMDFNRMLFNFDEYHYGYIDRSYRNTGRESLGFLTYTSDEQDINQAQAITAIGALLSANLIGRDEIGEEFLSKLVPLVESYYNVENGEGILLNYENGSSLELSFWEQVYPGMLYFMLMDRYEATLDSEQILRSIADNWYDVVMDLGGSQGMVDFAYTGYDFKQKVPYDNGEWTEPGAAAGVAMIQYFAYERFEDRKYMKAATECMKYLEEFQRNPGYEVVYLYLPYLSARLNAMENGHFDTAKYMEFFFTESDYRHEYGMFNGEYGTGLIGSRTEYGGTPESFASIVAATALVPMLKYDQRYAIEVGRYILHLTQSLNLFCPNNTVIPFDRVSRMNETENQKQSILSGAYLGLLAAMIEQTNVEGILKVDLNTNDYYVDEEKNLPMYLLFNPYDSKQEVQYKIQSEGTVNLYNVMTQEFITKNVSDQTSITINATDAVILAEVPVTEGENKYDEQRKIENSVNAKVLGAVNFVGLSQYEPISDNYSLDLDIKTMEDDAVSNINIYMDGNAIFQNVNYSKPYVVDVSKLANGYHLMKAEIITSSGLKDYAYARIFIQKDENPYLLNELPNNLINWTPVNDGSVEFINGDSEVRVRGGIESQPFNLDFSQVPMIAMEIADFTEPWSLFLKVKETGERFYIFENSTEAGRIKMSLNYALHQLNPKNYHLLGEHEVSLELETNGEIDVKKVRLFNQGLQPMKERAWKTAFTTQEITHWQARLNALGKVNYYDGSAVVKNLNKEGSGGIQTSYFEVDLEKNPKFTINVKDVDELWSLLVYVEGDQRGYYLQYPTNKTGVFSYDIYDTLKTVYQTNEIPGRHNLQFWIVSNGAYGAQVDLESLKLEYSKSWIEWTVIGTVAFLSVVAIFVNVNKDF